MAESIASDVAAELVSKFASSSFNEIGFCSGLGEELEKLKQSIAAIEPVLLDAEEQSLHNLQVKNWLKMLIQALYDADDLLDEFSTEASKQQASSGGSKVAEKVRLFFSSSNQFAFGLKTGRNIRELRQRLNEIAAEKSKFHLHELLLRGGALCNGRDQIDFSQPEVVFGREREKEAIVEVLLSPDYEENVSVVAIVGCRGIGKTTLARLAYNNDVVQEHFYLRIWICVSNDFDVQLLVKSIMESATRQIMLNTDANKLKNLLNDKLRGRKYLLVLDNVLNEDVDRWLSLKDLLASGARGSKILITTRLENVVEMSRPVFTHKVGGLSENDGWSLFRQMAIQQGLLPNPRLEAVGKEIVSKCRGVPLAIKTIGGAMYFKDPESEWVSFKDNELSKIEIHNDDIFSVLKLSYNHLPSHYKQCFAYCSLFLKDFKIPVDELIQLWQAQGYLKSTESSECLRDAGFQCFMDLYRLSFFQDVEKDEFGNVEYCKMHDLVHDLAVLVAGENFYASHMRKIHIQDNTRHVSFRGGSNYLSQYSSSLLKAKKIRMMLTQDIGLETKQEEIDAVFHNLRCLRVLGLSRLEVNKLPSSIYKLKHLRHLDLSEAVYIKKLPDSIVGLLNLEVLKLEGCINLKQLPSNIEKLVNLTDLDTRGCYKLSHTPRGIGKLTRLEMLSDLVISNKHSSGGLDELHSLNNLRGVLEIKNLRYVKNAASEFTEARLSLKQKLQKLTLYWGESEDENNDVSATDEETGMEALCPNRNLKSLKVWNYGGAKPPSWLPSITNLVCVFMQNCRSLRWLPPLDQLPYLKELRLFGLTKLERINVEDGGKFSTFFPSLTDLTLVDCPNLKGFERVSSLSVDELPFFPCLNDLEIRGCPNLTCMSLFPELKSFHPEGAGIKTLMEILKKTKNSASSPFLNTLKNTVSSSLVY